MSIPYAVKEGGLLSLTLLLLFAVICCYTGLLLMRCLQSYPGLHTYPDIGQAAFGTAGRLGIAVSTMIRFTSMVLNSSRGHSESNNIVKNRDEIRLIWPQKRSCCGFGNIKNCYSEA